MAAPAEQTGVTGRQPHRRGKPPSTPTHFVSLRISESKTVEGLRSVYHILREGPLGHEYSDCFVDEETFHISLAVFNPKDGDIKTADADAQRAFEAVRERVATELLPRLLPLPREEDSSGSGSGGSLPEGAVRFFSAHAEAAAAGLAGASVQDVAVTAEEAVVPLQRKPLLPSVPISGLATFGGKVLYASVPAQCPGRAVLEQMALWLQEALEEQGMAVKRDKPLRMQPAAAAAAGAGPEAAGRLGTAVSTFTPHVTLAKASKRQRGRAKGRKRSLDAAAAGNVGGEGEAKQGDVAAISAAASAPSPLEPPSTAASYSAVDAVEVEESRIQGDAHLVVQRAAAAAMAIRSLPSSLASATASVAKGTLAAQEEVVTTAAVRNPSPELSPSPSPSSIPATKRRRGDSGQALPVLLEASEEGTGAVSPSSSPPASAPNASPQQQQRGQGQGHGRRRREQQQAAVRFPESAWQDFRDRAFGNQPLAEVELCAMAGRTKGHYYRVLSKITF